MLTLAVFATGLLGGSLGVFSLVILEIVVCAAAFVGFWGQGFGSACWHSVEAGAVLTAGFICALIAFYLLDKFRFRLIALRQRDEGGLLDVVAGRDPKRAKVPLTRFR